MDVLYGSYTANDTTTSKNLWTRFVNYCGNQQEYRLFWLAVSLGGHGCIFTIATLFTIYFTGNDFTLFSIACCAMASVLIVNLAAMPTKITIPVLTFSLLVDIGLITAAFLL